MNRECVIYHLQQRQQPVQVQYQCHHLLTSLIPKCPNTRALRQVHAGILKLLLLPSDAYSKLIAAVSALPSSSPADVAYARRVFSQIPNPNIFAWNSLIRASSLLHPPSLEPISLYRSLTRSRSPLLSPNSFTLFFSLRACSSLPSQLEGLQLHPHALKLGLLLSSPFVHTALLNFYSKRGLLPSAHLLFDEIPNRNLVTWSAMISAYARLGMANQALALFRDMQAARVRPDEVTMVSVISACAKAGALDLGRWVHSFIGREGIRVDMELSTALIDMYAKCGVINKAIEVFDSMPMRDTKAWSSMIVGFAIHGLVRDALALFQEMLAKKVKPNHVTFIGVLSACTHSGLVSEGRKFWSIMQELGIEPIMEHYGCMVDLLCRTGNFGEAYSFVSSMPVLPSSIIWRTLLVGCKSSGSLDKGEIIAERLLELEPNNAENFVLLSNIYALNSQWEKVSYMRKKMKDSGVKVIPGLSSIEFDGFVHEFAVGDESHPEMKEIKEVLREIADRVRCVGHEPSTSSVLHDIGQEEKESALCEHSERLAIAFGLLKTKAPVTIRVVKNLRVCPDCHEVTKIISKLYEREIIVRDRVRFHRFVGGTCTCNDFW